MIVCRVCEILSALCIMFLVACAVAGLLDQRESARLIAETDDRIRVLQAMTALSDEELAERWER